MHASLTDFQEHRGPPKKPVGLVSFPSATSPRDRLMDHEREHGCDNIWEEVNVKGVGKPMYNIETRRRR